MLRKISTACAISSSRNDIKCKHIYVYPQKKKTMWKVNTPWLCLFLLNHWSSLLFVLITHKLLEAHRCVLSAVATGDFVLKARSLVPTVPNKYSAYLTNVMQIYLHLSWRRLGSKITFWKKCCCLRVKNELFLIYFLCFQAARVCSVFLASVYIMLCIVCLYLLFLL